MLPGAGRSRDSAASASIFLFFLHVFHLMARVNHLLHAYDRVADMRSALCLSLKFFFGHFGVGIAADGFHNGENDPNRKQRVQLNSPSTDTNPGHRLQMAGVYKHIRLGSAWRTLLK